MGKFNLSKPSILILFVVLISVGVGTASALATITLAGNTIVQGTLTADEYFDNGNTQTGTDAIALGGSSNIANGFRSTVGGGDSNMASGDWSSVAGGRSNLASGDHSSVSGGDNNEAAGDWSLAAGRNARALHDGAVVFADHTGGSFVSTAPDQFSIKAAGGVRIVGDVSAHNFEYSFPQTRSVVIFPVEFASTFDVDWLTPLAGAAGTIKSTSTKTFLFASIPQLPDGATLTGLDCRVFDNSAAQDLECGIVRKSFLGDTGQFLATVSTSGSDPSNQSISTTTISDPLVDRDGFGYAIRYKVTDESCDDLCKLFSAKVTYMIDKVE